MTTTIDETVSVDLLSNHLKHTAYPWALVWHGRKYRFTNVGLHYTVHEGRTLVHMFTVSDGITCFKLNFNTETLVWRLAEIETQ